MKEMTWDDYYSRFYDLSTSTQKSYTYRLTNFGPADEVFEVISELAFDDEAFVSRLTEKALNAGVRFTPDQVMELTILIDKTVLSKAAGLANGKFNRDQLEEIYSLIDDTTYEVIAKRARIDIFADDEGEEPIEEYDSTEYMDEEPQPKGPGFFATLFAALAAIGSIGGHKKKDTGRCDGDCANCPSHYGYRYGRWYYGHGHQHGCERGGNGGASGKTYRD